MTTYVYSITQIIEVEANSKEEAEGLLPVYPPARVPYYVMEEVIELLREKEEDVL